MGIAQVLRDTLDPTGPCPAIVVGDGMHFRNVLINSRTKTVSLVDPLGSGFFSDVKASIIDLYNKDNTGGWNISEWRVRMQHNSYSCGIWAIWIHEKWMQYWMLENTHINFEEWFTQQIQDIPSASSLREHYHEQMQTAMAIGQDGKSGFRRTLDISAERMASQRNAQELTRQHNERMMQGEGERHRSMEVQYFHHPRTTAFARGVEGSLHRTKDMSHKPNSTSRQVQTQHQQR